MENKKYLDMVIGSLVRSTKIDYENNLLSFPFPISTLINKYPYSFLLSRLPEFFSPVYTSLSFFPLGTFYSHCRNIFGLTKEETEYVWDKYRDIIIEKIKDGE